MSGTPPITISDSPGVRLMLPLLYVAWADRVLTPTEVNELRREAGELTFLTEADKAVLLQWSNPTRPPSRQLSKQWEIEIKKVAQQMNAQQPPSLTALGIALAEGAPEAARQGMDNWDMVAIRAVLARLEEGLTQVNLDTYRSLFPDEAFAGAIAVSDGIAGFSPHDMQILLDAPYEEMKEKMRHLLTDPFFAYRELPVKEDYREQVLAWLQELGDRGLGALSYPPAYGGENDMGNYAAVFEMLGYHDLSLSIKFGVQFGLFGGAVFALGTKRHHDKYLAQIGSMELPGCFAMTESGHGSNVRGLETTATYDAVSEEIIVHTPNEAAGKEYIGNALHGRMGAVFAQLIVAGENHGVHAVLVPLRTADDKLLPGIRFADNGYKIGLNGVDNGRLWFDQVRVPRENLLDRFGGIDEAGHYHSVIENPSRRFFTMLGTLVGGRVCVPRAGLSAAKSALTIAIKYALRRRQFAPTTTAAETIILNYPSHQRRLLPLLAKAYALHFALDYLLERYVKRDESDMREIETLAAGMKAYATWFTTHCIQQCREACGGKGYLAENRFGALKADTEIFTTFEGDNTVLLQLVAKGLLSDFRKEFNEEGNLAVLRYLTKRVATVLTEQNPVTIRNVDPDHLKDTEWLLGAFSFRERRLLASLAQRMRGLIKDGKSAYEAGLLCQTHMLALAEAFVEHLVLREFAAKVTRTTDASLQNTLRLLLQLYALSTIEEHKGWYLEQDYLASVKSKKIRSLVDELCAEVRPRAGALVASFGIPDVLLAAPIAF